MTYNGIGQAKEPRSSNSTNMRYFLSWKRIRDTEKNKKRKGNRFGKGHEQWTGHRDYVRESNFVLVPGVRFNPTAFQQKKNTRGGTNFPRAPFSEHRRNQAMAKDQKPTLGRIYDIPDILSGTDLDDTTRIAAFCRESSFH